MKISVFALAALLWVPCAAVLANADEAGYKQRAAQTDMSLFRELDRSGNGFLAREATWGDLNLGPRFDDIDTNRDEIITLQEMRAYIEKTYGVLRTPGG